MAVKLVGPPESTPVGLFIGSGVQDPPLPTQWGFFHLQFPLVVVPLPPIPGIGVMVLEEMVPMSPPAPYDIPLQALIQDKLSNLCQIEVE